MAWSPVDGPEVAYEFFAPFAHIEGRYEVCRIRSATHGVFDTFIVLHGSTSEPATVYVNSVLGESFMAERYPECTTIRVAPGGLIITEAAGGTTVSCRLQSDDGPVHDADLEMQAGATRLAQAVPYGGAGDPVWGSRFTCWGVDLNLRGKAHGHIRGPEMDEELRGEPCIVTLGSFGRIDERD